jgi:uncharacterized membrane protein
MTELVTLAICAAWLGCLFVALNAWSANQRRISVVVLGCIALGAVLVLARDRLQGLEWLRSERLRSDAVAIAALVPCVATGLGVVSTRTGRHSTWMLATGILVALAATFAGVGAIAIGRAGWYWEFVTVVVAGAAIAALGALGALRRAAGANERIVFGTAGTFGVFVAISGGAMLLAWRSIA